LDFEDVSGPEDHQSRTSSQQTAYDHWLAHTDDREQGRSDRLHGAVGIIPGPLWFVLLFISVVIFAYALFFADSGERAKSQAMLMGSVVAVLTEHAVSGLDQLLRLRLSFVEVLPKLLKKAHEAAVITFRGIGRHSGVEVNMEVFQLWTFRDGKLVRGQGFFERAEALKAAGVAA
jgi:hypothetical protein